MTMLAGLLGLATIGGGVVCERVELALSGDVSVDFRGLGGTAGGVFAMIRGSIAGGTSENH